MHIPSWLRKSLNPNQVIDAFDLYGEKVINWVSREGSVLEKALITSGVAAARPLAAIADQLMDAGMPGVNLYYGEKYNPFTMKRYRSADPFKQKGGVVRPKPSQSGARSMPFNPYKTSGRKRSRADDWAEKVIRKRTRRNRFLKGTYKMAPSSYFKVAKRMSRFKKAKKVVKQRGKMVARNYDDYGTIERDHCLWVGFQHHGSHDRLFDIIGEAFAKAILAKAHVYPRSYDEYMQSAELDRVKIRYERLNFGGSDSHADASTIVFHNRTFKQFAQDVADQIQGYADGDVTNIPITDTVAYYPTQFHLLNGTDNTDGYKVFKNIGDMLVSVTVKQKIKIQNVTKNVDGTLSIDQAGLNPLSGRKYVFNNHKAKLIESIQNAHSEYDQFADGHPTNTAPGISVVPVNSSFGTDNPISHPPMAKQLFTNCKAETAIKIAAGGMKVDTTTYRMVHKMRTLIERIYFTGYDKGAYGGITYFGLEKAFRQAKPSSAADDDRIAIGFNREVHMYAQVKFKTERSMLKHYDQTDCQVNTPA